MKKLLEVLRCPHCLGTLAPDGGESLRCVRCAKDYPLVAGIPDMRVVYSREQSLDKEQRAILEYVPLLDSLSFMQLWDYHLQRLVRDEEMSAEDAMFAKKVYLEGERRETNHARLMTGMAADDCVALPKGDALEIGCGSGFSFSVWSHHARRIIGIDNRMQELLLSKKQAQERGLTDVMLVCASAEHLPFAPATFSLVYSTNTIEHVSSPVDVVAQAKRVLVPGGILWLQSTNRFFHYDGHARLWGVGYLPRALQPAYVKAFAGRSYQATTLLSYWELDKCCRKAGFTQFRILTPSMRDRLTGDKSGSIRTAFRRGLQKTVVFRPLAAFMERFLSAEFFTFGRG